jgi:hypothetical protein
MEAKDFTVNFATEVCADNALGRGSLTRSTDLDRGAVKGALI